MISGEVFRKELDDRLAAQGVTLDMERRRCAARLRKLAADARKHAAEASGPRAGEVSAIFVGNAMWMEDAADDIERGLHWLLPVKEWE